MFCDFQTTTHAKWILAGEHAVLRGQAAIAFPILEKKLHLSYQPKDSDLSAEFEGSSGADLHLLFWSVLEHGQQLLGQSVNQLSGHFKLWCNIPIGQGLGASAALSMAMSRWFAAQHLLDPNLTITFAQTLEHLFHGKSSGLDIAAVASNSGIYFQQGRARPLALAWQPQWLLSSSDQVGITSHCIKHVNDLWQTNKDLAEKIDQRMQRAVMAAGLALEQSTKDALTHLQQAINEAHACFKSWGLISDTLGHHMDELLAQGALAVKPTGSGRGGYVLSLWEKAPPECLGMEFIALTITEQLPSPLMEKGWG